MILVGARELEDLFGVSRQRVQQLATRTDFPAPVAVLAMGKVWLQADVLAWASASNRRVNLPTGEAAGT